MLLLAQQANVSERLTVVRHDRISFIMFLGGPEMVLDSFKLQR